MAFGLRFRCCRADPALVCGWTVNSSWGFLELSWIREPMDAIRRIQFALPPESLVNRPPVECEPLRIRGEGGRDALRGE